MPEGDGPEGPTHTHAGSRRFKGIPLARVRGIPIQLHWSLLVALPVFAVALGIFYFPATLGIPLAWSLFWGTVMAVVLFTSVLLHEISHSMMAQHYQIPVERIILLPIGGLSQMREDPQRPGQELALTAMGPLTNFVIAVPFVALALLDVVPELIPGLGLFIVWAGLINVVLGAFNLFVPAFPMDGGRVLRSLLAMRVGRLRATQYAATTGRALAVFMGLFGLFVLGPGGILLIVIAIFIFMGATMERNLASYEQILKDTRVEDLMTREPVVTHPEDTLQDLFRTIQDTKHLAFPVIDDQERLLGCITVEELRDLPPQGLAGVNIRERMRDDIVTMEPDVPAGEALRSVLAKGNDHIAIVHDGRFLGFLTRTDMERTIGVAQMLSEERRPPHAAAPGGGS